MLDSKSRAVAYVGDLLLRIWFDEARWRASVEVVDDPDSVFSGGMTFANAEQAQRSAVEFANELFGTLVKESDPIWTWDSGKPPELDA